jgi:hypothetical protein
VSRTRSTRSVSNPWFVGALRACSATIITHGFQPLDGEGCPLKQESKHGNAAAGRVHDDRGASCTLPVTDGHDTERGVAAVSQVVAEGGEGAAKERKHSLPGHADHHGAGVGPNFTKNRPQPRLS